MVSHAFVAAWFPWESLLESLAAPGGPGAASFR